MDGCKYTFFSDSATYRVTSYLTRLADDFRDIPRNIGHSAEGRLKIIARRGGRTLVWGVGVPIVFRRFAMSAEYLLRSSAVRVRSYFSR